MKGTLSRSSIALSRNRAVRNVCVYCVVDKLSIDSKKFILSAIYRSWLCIEPILRSQIAFIDLTSTASTHYDSRWR